MSHPVTKFSITPSYASGFAYTWEVSGALADPGPWRFVVEAAEGPGGPWTAVSPDVINAYRWAEAKPRLLNKNQVLNFRVMLQTPRDRYYSDVISPYGDLSRRDFLMAREIMRQEVLKARTWEGVKGQLWLVSTTGPRCQVCIDPITGAIRDAACKACRGTGRNPPYNGPYDMWLSFSNKQQTTQMAADGTGTREPKKFQIRAIGAPLAKKNDLVVDVGSGKRYYVDVVDTVAEVRRVPVLQVLTVNEAPVSDPAYKVGL